LSPNATVGVKLLGETIIHLALENEGERTMVLLQALADEMARGTGLIARV
jgi:hypothetical protein